MPQSPTSQDTRRHDRILVSLARDDDGRSDGWQYPHRKSKTFEALVTLRLMTF